MLFRVIKQHNLKTGSTAVFIQQLYFYVSFIGVFQYIPNITLNKAKQHQSLRSLDSLVAALFVHGCAIYAQKSQQQVCRCWRRYVYNRVLSMFEYLEKIDNGSLKRAHRMSYEGSIWDAIENGYIYGEEETVDGEVFYKNLSLTKSGKEMLRFSKLTIKDIDNSYGKNSMKEWLLKPLVLESCKYILLAALAFLGGVYSAEIKEWVTSFLKEQTNQVEVSKSKFEK